MQNPSVKKKRIKIDSSFLKIGQAAQALGVSIDTLRRWEKAGKISTVRTPGGTRLYHISALKEINPAAEPYPIETYQTDSLSTEELLKRAGDETLDARNKQSLRSDDLQTSNIQPQYPVSNLQHPTSKLISKFLIGSAFISTITLLLTSWITASYLTQPKSAQQFFKNNIASPLFSPFHALAEEVITVIDPRKAKELGFAPPEDPPPIATNYKLRTLDSSVLAVTASSRFLELNADTQINGALFVRDSVNGLSLEATPSANSFVLGSGDTTLTVTNDALLDQDVSTSASPTFNTLSLSATSNQLVFQSGGPTGTLTWTPTAARVITLPDATGTVLLDSATQTITNKTINASNNTITNIPNSALANNKVTVTAGTNLTGGGDITLGSSATISLKDSISLSGTLTAGGVVKLADGTAAAPGLTFTNDTDTGLYRIGANSIGLITGGSATSGITIDASGNVGIGTISPSYTLDVTGRVNGSTALCIGGDCKTTWSGSAGNTASNGLTLSGVDLQLGGSLTRATGIDIASQNFGFLGGNVGIGTTSAGGSLVVASGNVGIGFTSPDRTTQIASDINITPSLASLLGANGTQFAITGSTAANLQKKLTFGLDTSDNYAVIQVGNTSGTAYGLVLNPAGGNVGIGTTNLNARIAGTSAPILRVVKSDGVGGGTIEVQNTTSGGGDSTVDFIDENGNVRGNIAYYARRSASDPARFVINQGWSEITTLNTVLNENGGNVGIGTTVPVTKLEVNGAITAAGGTTGGFIAGSGANYITLYTNSSNQGVLQTGAGDILFNPTGNSNFLIGNVGIGTTVPGSLLSVSGNATIGFGATTAIAGPSSGLAVSGNVGIGTTSPAANLEVIPSSNSYLRLFSTTDAPAFQMLGNGDSTNYAWFELGRKDSNQDRWQMSMAADGSNRLRFIALPTNSENLTLLPSGNVGIGATLPNAKLSIQGNVGIGYTGVNQVIPVNGLAVFGNVGIGTTTANSNLSISGNAHIGSLYQGISAPTNGLFVDGNVGIGATTSSNKLDVWGDARIAGTTTIDSTLTALNGLIGYSGVTAPTNGLAVSGNVGIGTTSPLAKLHNTGGTLFGTLSVSNLASGGNIGTAATTVDIYTSFNLSQTTASQTITLPDPTNTTAGRIIYLSNTGSTPFTFYGSTVKIGDTTAAMWDGDSWNLAGGGGLNQGTVSNSILRWNSSSSQWVENGNILAASDGTLSLNGNLGVGTTATPDYNLKVLGTGYFSGFVGIGSSLNVSGNVGIGQSLTITSGTVLSGGLVVDGGSVVLPAGSIQNSELENSSITVTATAGTGISVDGSPVSLGGTLTVSGIDASTSVKGVASFNSTNFSVSSGAVNTIQDIATSATPTFVGLNTSSGNVGIGTSATGSRLAVNGNGVIGWGTASVAGPSNGLGISGNLGVGTTSPNNALQVIGAGVFGADYGQYSAATNGLLIQGNVGIGATTSSNKLDVWGDARIAGTLTVDSTLTNSSVFRAANGSATAPSYSFTNLTNAGLWTNGDGLLLTTAGSSTSGITVTGAGNIGIGTTSPEYQLTVKEGTAGKQIYLRQSSADNGWLLGTANVDGALHFYRRGEGVSPTDTERLTISAGGSVGIGFTSPAATLDVVGTSLLRGTGGIYGLAVTSNGNVGIGTTAPTYQLQTTSNVGIGGSLTVSSGLSLPNSSIQNANLVNSSITVSATAGTGISVSGSPVSLGGTLTVAGIDASTSVKGVASFNSTNFSVSSGAVNTIQDIATTSSPTFVGLSLSSGNLGIGTSSTGAKLQVNGNGIFWPSTTSLTGPTNGLAVFGNVGIGTTSPNTKLSVVGGSVRSDTSFIITGAGTIAIGTNSNDLRMTGVGDLELGTNSAGVTMFLKSDGNVGIGTTVPGAKLAVSGNATIGFGGSASIAGPANGLGISGNLGIGTTTANSNLSVAGSAHIGSLYQGTAAPTNGLFVDGNVGIGATTSSNKLDVWGNAAITGSLTLTGNLLPASNDIFDLGSDAARWANLYLGPATIHIGTSTSDEYTISYDTTNDRLGFNVNGSGPAEIVMDSSGNLGIGTTNPGAKLEVNQTSGDVALFLSSQAANDNAIRFRTDQSNSSIGLILDNSNTNKAAGMRMQPSDGALTFNTGLVSGTTLTTASEKVRIDANGNVGIGTTNPGASLSVSGNGVFGFGAATSIAGPSNGLGISGSLGVGTTSPNNALQVIGAGVFGADYGQYSAATNGLLIQGNVGIGATTSSNKLDVWGDARIAGTATIDSTLTALNGLIGYSGITAPTSGLAISGNVGIGFTSPTAKLQLNNGQLKLSIDASRGDTDGRIIIDGRGSNPVNPALFLYANTSANAPSINFYDDTGTTVYGRVMLDRSTSPVYTGTAQNDFVLGTESNSNNLHLGTNSNVRLTVNNGGNVGIGITSPINKLHVYTTTDGDGITLAGTANPAYVISNSGTVKTYMALATSTGSYVTGSTANDLIFRTEDGTNGNILFATQAGNKMVMMLNRAGNVGIGLTTMNSQLSISDNVHIGSLYQGIVSPTNGLFVDGNVGIGATTSDNKLDVWGNARIAGTLGLDSSLTLAGGQFLAPNGTATLPSFSFSSSTGTGLWSPSTNALSLTTNGSGTSGITITANGNVGIGLTNPSAKLDIAGTSSTIANSSGSITITPASNLIISSGNVGIGFTSPTANLHILNTAAQDSFRVDDVANDSSPFVIDQGGNVGIGTASPTAPLIVSTASNQNIFFAPNNDTVGAGTAIDYIGLRQYGYGYVESGQKMIFNANIRGLVDGSFLFNYGPSQTTAMAIDGSGNVGIGFTSPAQALHLVGTMLFQPSSGSGQKGCIRFDATNSDLEYSNDCTTFQSLGASAGGWSDQGTYTRLTTTSANVGIGFSGPPDRKLSLANDIDITSSIASLLGTNGSQFAITGSSADGLQKKLTFGIDTTDNYGVIQAGNTSGTAYNLALQPGGGNVGIGTSSPGYIFDVQAAAARTQVKSTTGTNAAFSQWNNTGGNLYVGLENSVGGAGAGFVTTGGIAYAGVIDVTGAYPLQFATSDSVRMTINSGGNVGIGFTSPTQLFQVNANNPFVVTSGGNVGIGTASPDVQFNIAKDTDAQMSYFATHSVDQQTQITIVRSRGTKASPSDIANGDTLGSVIGQAYSAGYLNTASIGFAIDGTFTSGQRPPSRIVFNTNAANTAPAERLRISSDGTVRIAGLTSCNTIDTNVNGDLACGTDEGAAGSAGGWTDDGTVVRLTAASDNVGIGTASPGTVLDVQSATGQISLTSTTGTNYVAFQATNTGGRIWLGRERSTGGNILTGSAAYAGIVTVEGNYPLQFGTNDAVRMTIAGAGNVGIGFTSPAQFVDVYKSEAGGQTTLRIVNPENTDSTSRARLLLQTGGTSSGDPFVNFQIPGGSEWSLGVDNSDSDKLKIAQSGGLGNLDKLTIQTDGNVGIGDATPSYTLEVAGTLNVTGAVTCGSGCAAGPWTTYGSDVAFTGGNVGIGFTSPTHPLLVRSDVQPIMIGGAAPGSYNRNFGGLTWDVINSRDVASLVGLSDASIIAGGTHKLFVRGDSGNVGIGTTGPAVPFDVRSTASSANISYISGANSMAIFQDNPTRIDLIGYNAALTTYQDIAIRAGAAPNGVYITTGGNVGIGTTSPARMLQVYGGDIVVNNTTAGSTANDGLLLQQNGSTTYIGNQETADLQLFTDNGAGNAYIHLKSGGNVGIADNTPSYKLEVNGSFNATSVYSGGVLLSPGTGSNWTVSGAGIYRSAGNVGVGVSAPPNKFSVLSSDTGIGLFSATDATLDRFRMFLGSGSGAYVDRDVYFQSQNTPLHFQAGVAGNTEIVTFLPGGNVGIGWTSPNQLLEVNGAAAFGNSTTAGGVIVQKSGSIGLILGMNPAASAYNDLSIRAASSGATQLYLATSGNVGIGISSPTQALNLAGTFGIKQAQSDSVQGCIRYNSSTLQLQWSNDCTAFQAFSASAAGGWTYDSINNVVKLTTSTSNVGIGTSVPQAPLHVANSNTTMAWFGSTGSTLNTQFLDIVGNRNGGGSFEGLRFRSSSTAGDINPSTFFRMYHSNADETLNIDDGTTIAFTIKRSGGNVGIGTSNPGARLDVDQVNTTSNSVTPVFRSQGMTQTISSADLSLYFNQFQQSTVTASSSNPGYASTVRIDGGPIGAGSPTLINSSALHINNGSVGVGVTNSYAILAQAQTGAVNNYAASFQGGNVGIGTGSPTSFELQVAGSVGPNANDGGALGSTSLMWSDLFLANGGVINWNNGDVSLTQTGADILALGGNSEFQIGSMTGLTDSSGPYLKVGANSPSSFAATFYNDGGNGLRHGISIQAGRDDGGTGDGTTYYIYGRDGDGTNVGYISNSAGAGTFTITSVSDARFKRNIVDSTIDAISIIENLKVRDFERIEVPGVVVTGFIAQEAQAVYPAMVSENKEGYLGISKEALIPVHHRAIQEQQAQINNLIAQQDTNSTLLAGLSVNSDGTLNAPEVKTGKLVLSVDVNFATSSLANLVSTTGGPGITATTEGYEVDLLTSLNSISEAVLGIQSQESTTSAQLADIESRVESQESRVQSLEERLASISAQIATSSAQQSASSSASEATASSLTTNYELPTTNSLDLTPPDILLATQSAQLVNLEVTSDATISGQLTTYDLDIQNSLKSLGTTTLGTTTIAGDLNVDGTLSIENGSEINVMGTLYLQKSILADGVDFFNGAVTIDKTGTLAVKKITLPPEVLGEATIPAGSSEIPVFSNAVTQKSKVFLTPTTLTGGQSLIMSEIISGSGFVVKLEQPFSSDIKFNWVILDQR